MISWPAARRLHKSLMNCLCFGRGLRRRFAHPQLAARSASPDARRGCRRHDRCTMRRSPMRGAAAARLNAKPPSCTMPRGPGVFGLCPCIHSPPSPPPASSDEPGRRAEVAAARGTFGEKGLTRSSGMALHRRAGSVVACTSELPPPGRPSIRPALMRRGGVPGRPAGYSPPGRPPPRPPQPPRPPRPAAAAAGEAVPAPPALPLPPFSMRHAARAAAAAEPAEGRRPRRTRRRRGIFSASGARRLRRGAARRTGHLPPGRTVRCIAGASPQLPPVAGHDPCFCPAALPGLPKRPPRRRRRARPDLPAAAADARPYL